MLSHNRTVRGGARKTAWADRTWKLVVVVYGFPSRKAALQFEYAWQHAHSTAFLRSLTVKPTKSQAGKARLLHLHSLLGSRPFSRLSLGVQLKDWMGVFSKQEEESCLPRHLKVSIVGGSDAILPASRLLCADPNCTCPDVDSSVVAVPPPSTAAAGSDLCDLCDMDFTGDPRRVQCSHTAVCGTIVGNGCPFKAHVECTAEEFLDGSNELVPVQGPCPTCTRVLIWQQLLLQMNQRAAR